VVTVSSVVSVHLVATNVNGNRDNKPHISGPEASLPLSVGEGLNLGVRQSKMAS
jgi:hypothetical protein